MGLGSLQAGICSSDVECSLSFSSSDSFLSPCLEERGLESELLELREQEHGQCQCVLVASSGRVSANAAGALRCEKERGQPEEEGVVWRQR